jgi:hypothetical protein
MNPPAAIYQDNMVPDDNVAIPARRRPQTHQQLRRHRADPSAHLRREHEPLMNVRLPRAVPVTPLVVAEIIMMIVVPISSARAIMIVKMIVMIPIVVTVPIVLRPRQPRRTQRKAHTQCCCHYKPPSALHENPPSLNLNLNPAFPRCWQPDCAASQRTAIRRNT